MDDSKQGAQGGEPTPGQGGPEAAGAEMQKTLESVLGLVGKFEDPKFALDDKSREELVAGLKGYQTKRSEIEAAQAEAKKKQEEASKNWKAPDYAKVKLPDGSKVPEDHVAGLQKLAAELKWDESTYKTVLERDHATVEAYLGKVANDFKKYNEDSINTLKKDWGDKFQENTTKAHKVTEFFEKQLPGVKAEIDRLGLSNSVTANKLFVMLHDALEMGSDKFEFNGNQGAGDKTPLNRSEAEKAQALMRV